MFLYCIIFPFVYGHCTLEKESGDWIDFHGFFVHGAGTGFIVAVPQGDGIAPETIST
jgi:hypothetical protein